MSAPNTNIEDQKEKHKGPLAGMRLVLVFAAVLLAGLVIWTFAANDGVVNGEPVEGGAIETLTD